MNDMLLPEPVAMSTSRSTDAGADDAGVSDGNLPNSNQTPELQAAFDKLPQRFNPANLPRTADSSLWQEIRSTYALSLEECCALQNYACSPRNYACSPRPRGTLSRIESGAVYRVSDNRVRAKFTISNVRCFRRHVMEADLLVDSGANTELKLPARMVRQLGLEIRDSLLCRGSTNDVSPVLIFSPVFVQVTFIRGGVQEKIRADLSVQCDQLEYEAEASSQPGPAENGGGDTLDTPPAPQPTITGATTPGNNGDETSSITVVNLSATTHRPHDAPYQQAVIGIDGMKKLRLHLNSERQQLEIKEDEVVDEY